MISATPTAQYTAPSPALPQQGGSAGGVRSEAELARRVAEDHRRALQSRRIIDLTAERNMVWMDGEGDSQWATIYNGQRVAIPRTLNEYRVSHNLLLPIVDNAVAYHCTKPIHFIVEAGNDAQAKQQAVIDAALVNYVFREQRANAITAQAMYLACAAGFCPVHAAWRDDLEYDPYEPLYLKPEDYAGMQMPRKGLVDLWVGNPFDTTFNEGAKRGSYHTVRYGRVLPAQQVRDHFGVDVEGTDKLPSASTWQRVAQRWTDLLGLGQHGSAAMQHGRGGEELIALVCEEVAPGVETDYPDGRLTVVALNKSADTRREGQSSGGKAVHLTTIKLPSRRHSNVNFYSSHRFGDVHGAPWVSRLIPLQAQLNYALSEEWEYVRRMKDAPTLYSGDIPTDAESQIDGYTLIGIQNTSGASFTPKVMEIPSAFVTVNSNRIERIMKSMYTIGGYQAASRGESNAGDPFSKTAFLAEQDDTIHGPVNQEFKFSCEDLARLCHAIFRDNADVGWVVGNVGDEFDMLGDSYIDRSRVSQRPPQFRVVSGHGATSELEARQLTDMVQKRGADQQPLLTTAEFRQKYPNGTLFDRNADPAAAQRRRAKYVNGVILRLVQQFREENRVDARDYADPTVQQAAQSLVQFVNQRYPLLMTDDANANMAALSEMQQDETEDAIARHVAGMRWQQYQQWQQQMQMYQAGVQAQNTAIAQPQQEEPAKGAKQQQEQRPETPAATQRAAAPTVAAQTQVMA